MSTGGGWMDGPRWEPYKNYNTSTIRDSSAKNGVRKQLVSSWFPLLSSFLPENLLGVRSQSMKLQAAARDDDDDDDENNDNNNNNNNIPWKHAQEKSTCYEARVALCALP